MSPQEHTSSFSLSATCSTQRLCTSPCAHTQLGGIKREVSHNLALFFPVWFQHCSDKLGVKFWLLPTAKTNFPNIVVRNVTARKLLPVLHVIVHTIQLLT